MQFTLGYNFFYESIYNNAGVENTAENDEIIQSISISIRPAVDDPEGVIFYSRTTYSQQLLEVRLIRLVKPRTPVRRVSRYKRTVLSFATEAKQVPSLKV